MSQAAEKLDASNESQEKAKGPQKPSVKCKIIRDIRLEREKGNMQIIKAGTEILLTQDEAALFCDVMFQGTYAFMGERIGDNRRHQIVRAIRV